MQNPNSVMSQAFDGYVTEIADELGISYQRVNEMLGRDNPYPKCWRLLNPLGRTAPNRLRHIQADFNARCERILGGDKTPTSTSALMKELHEAIQKVVDNAAACDRKKELLEARAQIDAQLALCGD